MKRVVVLAMLLVLALTLTGCKLPGAPEPTPTLPPLPPAVTKVPLNTLPPLPTFTKPATQPQVVTATQPATQPTQPAAPTLAPTAGTAPTATKPAPTQPAPTKAAPTQAAATQVPPSATASSSKENKIFLIAINDNGVSGKKIGCGDSVVAVVTQVADPAAPLRGTLDNLLAVHSQFYGQSGLYNALFRSDLKLKSVTIKNEVAEIQLTGSLTLGGVCDSPRVQAQLEETALQFATVKSVNITINGKRLQDLLSGK